MVWPHRPRNIQRKPLDEKSKPTGLLHRCPHYRQQTVILYNTRDFGVSSNKPVVNHRSLIKMNGLPEVGEQTKVIACSVHGLWVRCWKYAPYAFSATTVSLWWISTKDGITHDYRICGFFCFFFISCLLPIWFCYTADTWPPQIYTSL